MTKSSVSKIFLNQDEAIAIALNAMTSKRTIQYECLPEGEVRITVDQEYAALLKEKSAPSYVYVQEGGSMSELYLHEHETKLGALAGRLDCALAGAYKTGAVVEIAPCLRALGSVFYATAEALVGTTPCLVFYG
ncbi:hypothetical protein GTP81_10190 [Rugamonas sp. FT107W]|uniref:Uncharacterized protein n=1 Tax=Duganella vulcania TaxID=2692166 RepID=A0A845HE80_9BURK|nr:hypothetical protein [Duganella vulcania]MYN17120.1 hypothetical protein [Duganella vulcania]